MARRNSVLYTHQGPASDDPQIVGPRREAPLSSSSPGFDAPLDPVLLPVCGHPERWPALQRLRRHPAWELEPWLRAIEAGRLMVDTDLFAVLAERLDGPACLRLLRWWAEQPQPDPRWPGVLCRVRDPGLAAWLRRHLASPEAAMPMPSARAAEAAALLPLLGFQRQAEDGELLAAWALAPRPVAVRSAALEGLAVGLAAWPLPPLRRVLQALASDLNAGLAATAIDLLARLPGGRGALLALPPLALDAAVEQRRQRRLAALPAAPLLLVVHGRAGGVVPVELQELAVELKQRRRAPVLVQALTGAPPFFLEVDGSERLTAPLTLVPLMLLPGGHVRHDIPAIAAHWRRQGPVRRLPFLGAWPCWQRALAAELAELRERAALAAGVGLDFQTPAQSPPQPLLLHHPLEGTLARRFLAHLEACTGARCMPASYSDPNGEGLLSSLIPAPIAGAPAPPPLLPLALAANRLTDSLASLVGPPLLQRPRFSQLLLAELEALP